MDLAGAIAAAKTSDWRHCLSALLTAWREHPLPALAELIERVSARVEVPPVSGGKSMTANVKARIAAATDADVAPICELALREMQTFPRAYVFVVMLAGQRLPDPRIATALVKIVEDPPWVDFKRNDRGGLQDDVVAALDAIDDPRYRGKLVEWSARLEKNRGYTRKYKRQLDALAAIAKRVADRDPPEPVDDPAALDAAIAAIDSALGAQTPKQQARKQDKGELLAAIYASPDDTSLRLIYADVLQEAGDPRGEFIGLQCGRADHDPPSKRERELLRAHEREWLGDLEPIVQKQGVVFQRGFVAALRENLKYTKHYALFESPGWSTVEHVSLHVWSDVATKFLTDPRWKALRGVHSLYRDTIPTLIPKAPLPWTTLGIRYAEHTIWPAIAELLPHLETLDLAECANADSHLATLRSSKLVERLHRIRVCPMRTTRLGSLLAAAPADVALEIVPEWTFPPVREGCALVIEGTHATLVHHDQKLDPSFAAAVLKDIPAKRIESVSLQRPAKVRVDEAGWSALEAALRRHDLTLARP